MSAEGGTKAVVAALFANLGIAVTKFVAFVLTGAHSMLAEAIHSVADSGNQVLLLVGGKQAQTGGHPGAPVRLRPRALRLLASSSRSCCSASAACSRSTRPTTSGTRSTPTATRTSCSRAAGGGFRRWCSARDRRWRASPSGRRSGSPTRSRAARRSRSSSGAPRQPELPVILLEDFAALVGLVFALFGVGLIAGHRQRLLRRHRHRADRPAAGRGGDRARRSRPRACCSASPPASRAQRRIAEALDRHARRRADHPHEDAAPRARRSCWSPPRSPYRPGRPPTRSPTPSIGPRRRSAPPSPPRRSSTSSRTSTAATTCPPSARSPPPPRGTDPRSEVARSVFVAAGVEDCWSDPVSF